MIKLGLEKAEETEIKLPTSIGSQNSKRILEKNICFIDYTKAFDYVDHNKLENSQRDRNSRPPYLPPEKPVCRSRSNSQTGSKLGKEYVKVVYCYADYLTYMQSTSCEMLGWMKHKQKHKIQYSSVTQSCPTLCDPMDCTMPAFPVHHQLPRACSNSCPSNR